MSRVTAGATAAHDRARPVDATGRRLVRRIIALVTTAALAASILVGVGLTGAATPAQALSGADFDPGNIVSDQVFFNGGAMNEGQIQQFLDGQIGSCTNSNCMNVKRTDTSSRGADPMCGAYQGAASESVARIIAKVGAACGINPQVLLVTLQKEQGLISGSAARGPSDARVERAMGYACPDSANGGCDPTYAGVYNQIYRAAWQFKRYANPAGTSNYFQQYAPGGNRTIQFNPSAACGSKTVFIRNQATANLYYYTPYTPNAAALANLNGTGDGCSAYGNRNFWVYFNSWFGSPTGDQRPVGSVDSLSAGVESVSLRGWAVDLTSSASIQVHVYVGSAGTPLNANLSRPDVAAAYPGKGAAHGFDYTIAAAPGAQRVCVYAIGVDAGSARELTCRDLVVKSGSPVGSADAVLAVPGGVNVRGWALDPETPSSIQVHAYVDGVGYPLRAEADRPDVARAYPGLGSAHGFARTLPASPGVHQVCLYAINTGKGANTTLSCDSVRVVGGDPVGSLDTVTVAPGRVSVSGWVIDGDTTAPVPAHVYVDGVGRALTADQPRSDIGRVYPAYGAPHGFSGSWTTTPGSHQVCAYGINGAGSGNNALLGCRTVVVPPTNARPLGSVDDMTAEAGGIRLRGWAFDPDTATSPTSVHVYVDGRATAVRADQPRSDVARAYPAAGASHGFQSLVAAASGSHPVCVYALDTGGGENATLSCRTVVVP
jgi:hypothetical protein